MKKIIAIVLAVAAVFCFAACGKSAEDKVIKVGASSTPHAEILEQVKDTLAEEGYELEIVIYDDYVLPNQALDEGSLDANYFQHTPISTASTPPTALTWSPPPSSTMSPSASTATA